MTPSFLFGAQNKRFIVFFGKEQPYLQAFHLSPFSGTPSIHLESAFSFTSDHPLHSARNQEQDNI